MAVVRAPFTADQVDSLNAYQVSGVFHEFTCGNDDCARAEREEDMLRAGPEGWLCPLCGYRQDWCHDWMADWSWRRGLAAWHEPTPGPAPS